MDVIELHFDLSDLSRIRFTTDPVWETAASLNALVRPQQHLLHERLQDLVPRNPSFDLAHLRLLGGHDEWVPDLLGPPPLARPADPLTAFEALLESDLRVAETDLDKLRELCPGAVPQMTPEQYLEVTVTALSGYWRAVLQPIWGRIEAILDGDIAHHRAVVAAGGLAEALPGLHEALSFTGECLSVDLRHHEVSVPATGHGIWLVPSVFRWPWVAVDARAESRVISYAARGAGRLWEVPSAEREAELANLLGRSRASILEALDLPATTTALASRLLLSPSTVSEHLSVMCGTGLLHSWREGRRVLYARTDLADLLLQGEPTVRRFG